MTQATTQIRFQENFCIENRPEPCGMIIFGASGDLTHRKLLPALYRLFHRKLLPPSFYILGCARSKMDHPQFRQKIATSLALKPGDDFLQHCYYLSGNYQEKALYTDLAQTAASLDQQTGVPGNHLFYLSTPPNLYGDIVTQLGAAGLTPSGELRPWSRVIIEKPLGHDLESARALDTQFHQTLQEDQIYRIDHYLGKETVQNILMFRFANSLFEPIWNRDHIDHVQLTVAESLGVEHRAGYYEQAGALRDMFQNHLLQMLALVAMEPPSSFAADRVRDEKVKLLRSIKPFPNETKEALSHWVVRGQYTDGTIDGQPVPRYVAEPNVAPKSQIETFAAMKILIDNWRWHGVPFYVRSGKRLSRRASEIAITFKPIPHSLFHPLPASALAPNTLIFHVQPDEGASLTIQAKHPGPKLCIGSLNMDYRYQDVFKDIDLPDAYERLLLDCMLGDQTLFIRQDGLETAWELLTPILAAWQHDATPPHPYAAGSWGPAAADALLAEQGHAWRTP